MIKIDSNAGQGVRPAPHRFEDHQRMHGKVWLQRAWEGDESEVNVGQGRRNWMQAISKAGFGDHALQWVERAK